MISAQQPEREPQVSGEAQYQHAQALVDRAAYDVDDKFRAVPGTSATLIAVLQADPNGLHASWARVMLTSPGMSWPDWDGTIPTLVPTQAAGKQQAAQDGDEDQQEIESKIERLKSGIESQKQSAENNDKSANQVLNNCSGPGAALSQSIGELGAAKFRQRAAQARNQADADQEEIERLEVEQVQARHHLRRQLPTSDARKSDADYSGYCYSATRKSPGNRCSYPTTSASPGSGVPGRAESSAHAGHKRNNCSIEFGQYRCSIVCKYGFFRFNPGGRWLQPLQRDAGSGQLQPIYRSRFRLHSGQFHRYDRIATRNRQNRQRRIGHRISDKQIQSNALRLQYVQTEWCAIERHGEFWRYNRPRRPDCWRRASRSLLNWCRQEFS
jgi:hypothetical protein